MWMTLLCLACASTARADSSSRDARLRGYTDCQWGEFGCNVCVDNVPQAFRRMGANKDARHSYTFFPSKRSENGVPPLQGPSGGHVQSVQRLSGVESDNWMLVTMSANYRETG